MTNFRIGGTEVDAVSVGSNEVDSVFQGLDEVWAGIKPSNPGSPFLDGVIGSCIMDVDATIAASYDPGVDDATLKNLIDSPANGDGQTVWDLGLGLTDGVDTVDPIFVGTAGLNTAHFTIANVAFNDGGYFRFKNGVPTKMETLHRTDLGEAFTIMIAMNFADEGVHGGNPVIGIFSSVRDMGQVTPVGSLREGITASISSQTIQMQGDSTTTPNRGMSGIFPGFDKKNYNGINWLAGNMPLRRFDVGLDDQRITINTVLPDFASVNPPSAAMSLIDQCHGDGHKIYGIYIFDKFLGPSSRAAVNAHLRTRHNRAYDWDGT